MHSYLIYFKFTDYPRKKKTDYYNSINKFQNILQETSIIIT